MHGHFPGTLRGELSFRPARAGGVEPDLVLGGERQQVPFVFQQNEGLGDGPRSPLVVFLLVGGRQILPKVCFLLDAVRSTLTTIRRVRSIIFIQSLSRRHLSTTYKSSD